MANTVRRPKGNGPIGVSPTTSQKLLYVSQKAGLKGIEKMQGSTVMLYDTVLLSSNAARQTLSFFGNTAGKSQSFSNFQANMLKAGETIAMEDVTFIVLVLSGTDLNSDATAIENMEPVASSSTILGLVQAQTALNLGKMQITLSNKLVQKNVLGYELHPAFNPKSTGMVANSADLVAQSKIPLESPPVLVPNNSLQLDYSIPPVGTLVPPVGKTLAVMCVIGRFGSIMSVDTPL